MNTPNMIIFAEATQKGGVGKSTTACHLAFYLEERLNQELENAGIKRKARILFINCETQGNSSKTMAIKNFVAPVTSQQFFERDLFDIPEQDGITVVHGGGFLADIDKDQTPYLKAHLERFKHQYDFCVLDTPPTAGVLQVAPLVAADYVLSPIEMEDYSMDAVVDTIRTILGVKQKFNPNLQFLGLLPNKVKTSARAHREKLAELVGSYPDYMLKADLAMRIGDRQAIPQALGMGVPVWNLRGGSKEAASEMLAVMEAIYSKVKQ